MQRSRRFAAAALAVVLGSGVAVLPNGGPAQAAPAAPATAAAAVKTATAAAAAKTAAKPRVSWLAPARNVFSARSVWKTPVVRAPLNRRSAAMTRQLTHQVHEYYGGTAAFNAYQYNVSFVTVPRGQRRVTVAWNNCQHKDYTPAGLTGSGGVLTGVPIPPKAHPADGTDGELTIYSPATDQIWELWEAQQDPQGRWSACWGGRIDHASTSRGWFDNGFGASASGLAISAGMVSFADMRRGYINHALSLAIPDPASWDNVSWPAQRSDGSPTTTSLIPEGTRFRLAANVNLAHLHLTPLARMIARAAKRYGFIVTDMAGAVSVTGESGMNLRWRVGANPWDRLLGTTPAYLQLKNFPWARLQALPKSWGEPTR